MQGQKRAIGSLPEGLSFDHGSSSSGAGVDEQICWNTMRNSAQNRLTGYNISPSNTSDMYLNSTIQEGQNLSGWNIGEPSSSATQNQPGHGDRKTEHGWSSSMKACVGAGPNYDAQQYETTSMLTLDDDSVSLSRNQIANGPLFMQSSSSDSIPHDLNTNSAFSSHGVVERRVMECPNAFKPGSSERLRLGTAGSSFDPFGAPSGGIGGYLEETDSRPGCSSEGRRLSCKRKALEVNIGQSSDSGSSNFFQRPESVWHAVPSRRNVSSSLSISTSAEDSTLGAIPSEQIIPRLGLGVGVGSSENPIVLGSPGPVENSRRNVRLRINASHQQDAVPTNNVLTTGSLVGHANPVAPYPPSRLLPVNNNHADLRSPAAAADNSSPQSQSVLRLPGLRRNMQSSRWNRSSSSRASRSSSFLISGERDTQSSEEPNSRTMPRNISEHPMFVSATETRNSAQNGFMWSSTGGNVIAAGNVASSSRAGSSSGIHPSSAPNWAPHRNSPHYPRRLSEMVRRSLLSSTGFEAGGGQSNNVTPPASGTSAPVQEASLPSGAGNQGHHQLPHSRSALLLDRQLDGAFGLPYSLRNLATAGDGRSRLVSEIRNVLDLMRRGEGLRFEDVMILDQSVFYGMADVHDRHRDMRLDVDNMSYEELLALEDRIGNVNTGLTEETISIRLKRRKCTTGKTSQQDPEPCSICREEYNNGEDVGALECGHDFHTECIKQWLMQKNLCPICKSTGLTT